MHIYVSKDHINIKCYLHMCVHEGIVLFYKLTKGYLSTSTQSGGSEVYRPCHNKAL